MKIMVQQSVQTQFRFRPDTNKILWSSHAGWATPVLVHEMNRKLPKNQLVTWCDCHAGHRAFQRHVKSL